MKFKLKISTLGEAPNLSYQVSEHWDLGTVSGGRVIAFFYKLEEAEEYIEFKTKLNKKNEC